MISISAGPKLVSSTINNISSKIVPTTTNAVTETVETHLPQFLYHLTPSSNLEKILQSGKISVSNYEKLYRNGLTGVVYTVDKENFIKMWLSSKFQLGVELIKCILNRNNGKLSVIKIPVSSLDKTKIKFSPYETYSRRPFGEITKGLPVSELHKYKEPIEYVYTQEIPVSVFSGVKNSEIKNLSSDSLSDIF